MEEKRDVNLYIYQSFTLHRRGECKLTDVQMTRIITYLRMQTKQMAQSIIAVISSHTVRRNHVQITANLM